MKFFLEDFKSKLSLNSEKVKFITMCVSDASENVSNAKISRSSFLRTFRNGIRKGFEELMMSTDMSVEGTGC